MNLWPVRLARNTTGVKQVVDQPDIVGLMRPLSAALSATTDARPEHGEPVVGAVSGSGKAAGRYRR